MERRSEVQIVAAGESFVQKHGIEALLLLLLLLLLLNRN